MFLGMATLGSAVSMMYMKSSPVVTHTVNAEVVEGKTKKKNLKQKHEYRYCRTGGGGPAL